MTNGQNPTALGRFGKLKVKTVIRAFFALLILAAAVYFGRPLWHKYVSGDDDTDQTAQQIRKMRLEAQFAGPLQDTVVQRWADPDTGVTCYIYLPIVVQHSKPLDNGMVHYGANAVGSISCLPSK